MTMECPYCNHEMYDSGEYWRGTPERIVNGSQPYPLGYYSPASSDYEVLGNQYKCRNIEGFPDEDQALEYWKTHESGEAPPWEEIVCPSCDFNGFFHTRRGELKEGLAC